MYPTASKEIHLWTEFWMDTLTWSTNIPLLSVAAVTSKTLGCEALMGLVVPGRLKQRLLVWTLQFANFVQNHGLGLRGVGAVGDWRSPRCLSCIRDAPNVFKQHLRWLVVLAGVAMRVKCHRSSSQTKIYPTLSPYICFLCYSG